MGRVFPSNRYPEGGTILGNESALRPNVSRSILAQVGNDAFTAEARYRASFLQELSKFSEANATFELMCELLMFRAVEGVLEAYKCSYNLCTVYNFDRIDEFI